jgi:hypothetical protein
MSPMGWSGISQVSQDMMAPYEEHRNSNKHFYNSWLHHAWDRF